MAASLRLSWLRPGVELGEPLLRKHRRESEGGRAGQRVTDWGQARHLLTGCAPGQPLLPHLEIGGTDAHLARLSGHPKAPAREEPGKWEF